MGLYNEDFSCPSCGREGKGLEKWHLLFCVNECSIYICRACKHLSSSSGEEPVCPQCGGMTETWDFKCPECGTNMLRMIGFGENLGSGFPKIIAAWKETNWGEPQLLNKIELDEVELVLSVSSHKSAVDTVNDTVNDTVKLTMNQQKIVDIIKLNNHITYDEMATSLNVSRKTIARQIANLKEMGVLLREGEDKNGLWLVVGH